MSNINLEKRAREIYESGNVSVKEAFDLAKQEQDLDLPDGFMDIFNLRRKK